jgi:oxygen-dependent protoporphyrinogen oxidase
MASVGVIGAGIAGLTAAHHVHHAGLGVTVFEAADQVGGKIRSERAGGYLIEHGPNTIQTATPLMNTLIDRLGLADAVVAPHAAAKKRYIVRDGRPQPLPTSPLDFFRTGLLSTRGKLRLLAEPFMGSSDPEADESLADFARRRFGQEVLDYGLNPFVAGIFAGDPSMLSVRHAFTRLYELEQEHGSLLRGLFHRMRNRSGSDTPSDAGPARRMFSFQEGLQTLPDALAASLTVRCATPVTELDRDGAQWRLVVRPQDASPESHTFDAVISTVPLHRFAALDVDTELDLSPFARVTYPPVSVVAMGFRRADVSHPLDGFGMLVPEVEDDYQILGTIFSSTLFPDRAPDGHVLLTTFVGGARHPALGHASPDRQQAVIERDLEALLDTTGRPTFVQHARWPHAIPQYNLGYGRVKRQIDQLEARHARLYLAGNYRDGISVGDAMRSGQAAAQRCLRAITPEAVSAS